MCAAGARLASPDPVALRARDLMQAPPITIAAHVHFLEIQHLFVRAGIGGAPVLDERGRVIGIVSASDLLRAVDQAFDEDVDPAPRARARLQEQLDALTARDLATPEVVWVSPLAPLAEVARVMRDEGIHRVLVGDRGRLEGVLTTFDLLRALDERAPREPA